MCTRNNPYTRQQGQHTLCTRYKDNNKVEKQQSRNVFLMKKLRQPRCTPPICTHNFSFISRKAKRRPALPTERSDEKSQEYSEIRDSCDNCNTMLFHTTIAGNNLNHGLACQVTAGNVMELGRCDTPYSLDIAVDRLERDAREPGAYERFRL